MEAWLDFLLSKTESAKIREEILKKFQEGVDQWVGKDLSRIIEEGITISDYGKGLLFNLRETAGEQETKNTRITHNKVKSHIDKIKVFLENPMIKKSTI